MTGTTVVLVACLPVTTLILVGPTCVILRSIYSLMTRIDTSVNPIVKSIVEGDVFCTSILRNLWTSLLYNM